MQQEPLWTNVENLVEALAPYVPDDATKGRISADLKDLIETSRWLLEALSKIEGSFKKPDDLETFLIDFEVSYLDHTRCHIASLKKDLRTALKAFPPGN